MHLTPLIWEGVASVLVRVQGMGCPDRVEMGNSRRKGHEVFTRKGRNTL